MDRRTGTYVYGSEARSLDAQPLRRREEEIRRRERQQQKKRPVPKQKVDKVAVLLICVTFAAAFGIGIGYLHLQFKTTYLSKNVLNLQREVVELEKENVTSLTELENTVDLEEIYAAATQKLGMKTAKRERIFTYKSRKSTQVRQHGKIPSN